jgi:glycosyltransferase involved in cell wall biosynthesis
MGIEIFVLTYNRNNFLKQTLESIFLQTDSNFYLTVIDNGSNEANIVNPSNYNFQFRLIRNEANRPFNEVSNQIKDLVRGEYVMIFHDDDLLHPNYIQICKDVIFRNKNLSIIGCYFQSFILKAKPFSSNINCKLLSVDKFELAKLFYKGECIHFGSFVYKTSIFKSKNFEIGIYGKICDRPFVLSCLDEGFGFIIKNELVNYRIHENQDSVKNVSGPFSLQLINLEKLYFNLLTKSFFSVKNFQYKVHCFRYLINNFKYLKHNNLFDGSFINFIFYSLKNKATNVFSLIVGYIFFNYLNMINKRK